MARWKKGTNKYEYDVIHNMMKRNPQKTRSKNSWKQKERVVIFNMNREALILVPVVSVYYYIVKENVNRIQVNLNLI